MRYIPSDQLISWSGVESGASRARERTPLRPSWTSARGPHIVVGTHWTTFPASPAARLRDWEGVLAKAKAYCTRPCSGRSGRVIAVLWSCCEGEVVHMSDSLDGLDELEDHCQGGGAGAGAPGDPGAQTNCRALFPTSPARPQNVPVGWSASTWPVAEAICVGGGLGGSPEGAARGHLRRAIPPWARKLLGAA